MSDALGVALIILATFIGLGVFALLLAAAFRGKP